MAVKSIKQIMVHHRTLWTASLNSCRLCRIPTAIYQRQKQTSLLSSRMLSKFEKSCRTNTHTHTHMLSYFSAVKRPTQDESSLNELITFVSNMKHSHYSRFHTAFLCLYSAFLPVKMLQHNGEVKMSHLWIDICLNSLSRWGGIKRQGCSFLSSATKTKKK